MYLLTRLRMIAWYFASLSVAWFTRFWIEEQILRLSERLFEKDFLTYKNSEQIPCLKLENFSSPE